jgi:hypothetical protein
LELSVDPNFEEGSTDTIFAKALEECAQSLSPPSSISFFAEILKLQNLNPNT